jgi:hypothetical protein
MYIYHDKGCSKFHGWNMCNFKIVHIEAMVVKQSLWLTVKCMLR